MKEPKFYVIYSSLIFVENKDENEEVIISEGKRSIPYYIQTSNLFECTEQYIDDDILNLKYVGELTLPQFIELDFQGDTCATMGMMTDQGYFPAFCIEGDDCENCYVSVRYQDEIDEADQLEFEDALCELIDSDTLTLSNVLELIDEF